MTSGFEWVFCILSFWIVPKIGSINSMTFVLLGYAVRFAIMAMIEDPWLALLQTVIGGNVFYSYIDIKNGIIP